MNSKILNIALMSKRIWRLLIENQSSLWQRTNRAKYPEAVDIFAANASGGSQFWRAIHKIKHHFKVGTKYIIGLGNTIRFLD